MLPKFEALVLNRESLDSPKEKLFLQEENLFQGGIGKKIRGLGRNRVAKTLERFSFGLYINPFITKKQKDHVMQIWQLSLQKHQSPTRKRTAR